MIQPGYYNVGSTIVAASSNPVVPIESLEKNWRGWVLAGMPKLTLPSDQMLAAQENDSESKAQAAARPEINPNAMATVDFIRIKARDGLDLPVWITAPKGRKAGDGGPAIVMVHGGPTVRGEYWRWNPMNQYLASLGYVVISPEFRG